MGLNKRIHWLNFTKIQKKNTLKIGLINRRLKLLAKRSINKWRERKSKNYVLIKQKKPTISMTKI